MFGIDDAIAAGAKMIDTVIERLFPDATEEQRIKSDQIKDAYRNAVSLIQRQVDVIVAEAKGESWLQRSWRPIAMLNFLVLVNAYFFGWNSPTFGAEMASKLFDLIELGLGGYIVGRSAEKIVPSVVDALKR